MRLLFVIDNLRSGGAQRQLVMLAEGLVARGHVVEFFTYYRQNFFQSRLEKLGIQIHEEPKRFRFSVGVPFALRRTMCGGRYDVVLAFMDVPSLYAELARVYLRSPLLVVSERTSDNRP